MKTSYDCIPCIIQSVIKLFENEIIDASKKEKILKKILNLLLNIDLNLTSPQIAASVHRIVREISGNKDPYKEVKLKYNNICLNIYNKLKDYILKSDNPEYRSMKLAIIGNIIDFGLNHSFDIIKTVLDLDKIDLMVDDSSFLFNDIRKSKNVLYLGDNTGEIVFDKLFLEILNMQNIFFAVRGNPVLNDATKEDAYYIGLNKITTIIDTGQDLPGIDVNNASREFLDIYNNADLIISKGQGNFESLSHIKNKNIYFLLMAKCELVANELNVKKGDIVVKRNYNKVLLQN